MRELEFMRCISIPLFISKKLGICAATCFSIIEKNMIDKHYKFAYSDLYASGILDKEWELGLQSLTDSGIVEETTMGIHIKNNFAEIIHSVKRTNPTAAFTERVEEKWKIFKNRLKGKSSKFFKEREQLLRMCSEDEAHEMLRISNDKGYKDVYRLSKNNTYSPVKPASESSQTNQASIYKQNLNNFFK